jgi:hypothetical protein
MPRIRFTADPKLPRDLAHLEYRKDQEVDLPDDQADRWLRRGVAVVIPDEPEKPAQRAAPKVAETQSAGETSNGATGTTGTVTSGGTVGSQGTASVAGAVAAPPRTSSGTSGASR